MAVHSCPSVPVPMRGCGTRLGSLRVLALFLQQSGRLRRRRWLAGLVHLGVCDYPGLQFWNPVPEGLHSLPLAPSCVREQPMNEAVLSLASTAASESIGSPSLLRVPPSILEILPTPIYACDAVGRILWFNRKAVDLWGRVPRIGDDTELFCGSYRWLLNGRHIESRRDPDGFCPQDRCGGPRRGGHDRTTGRLANTRRWCTSSRSRTSTGKVIGAINCIS